MGFPTATATAAGEDKKKATYAHTTCVSLNRLSSFTNLHRKQANISRCARGNKNENILMSNAHHRRAGASLKEYWNCSASQTNWRRRIFFFLCVKKVVQSIWPSLLGKNSPSYTAPAGHRHEDGLIRIHSRLRDREMVNGRTYGCGPSVARPVHWQVANPSHAPTKIHRDDALLLEIRLTKQRQAGVFYSGE